MSFESSLKRNAAVVPYQVSFPRDLPAAAQCDWEYGSQFGPDSYFQEWLGTGDVVLGKDDTHQHWAIWTVGIALLKVTCDHINLDKSWWEYPYLGGVFRYANSTKWLEIMATAMFSLFSQTLAWRKFYLTLTFFGNTPEQSTVEYRIHISNQKKPLKMKNPTVRFNGLKDSLFRPTDWHATAASVVMGYGGPSCKLVAATMQQPPAWDIYLNRNVSTDPTFSFQQSEEEQRKHGQ